MVVGFTYGTIHSDLLSWECPTSIGMGAWEWMGYGEALAMCVGPVSPSLNFCNFSFKRKVNETRMYDPTMSSFLSVDAYVQSPDNSQNFNQYAYCLNNPLRYTDPSGESFILLGLLVGTERGRQLIKNDVKIWNGLFVTDSNKNFGGQSWELISRFTWQAPQTTLGYSFTKISNLMGQVDEVDYFGGSTVASGNFFDSGSAVTLGSYINGKRDLAADSNNSLFQHEYGHYLQSQEMGPAYLVRVGIPSLLSSHNHDFHPVEQDANRRAFLYFNKHVEGFYKTEADLEESCGWDFVSNPLDINKNNRYDDYVDHHSSSSLQLLDNLTIHAKWYDYASWTGCVGISFNPLFVGIYNAIKYNFQY